MLKKSASLSIARRARLARQARSKVRSSGFEVQKTSDLRPSRLSRQSRVSRTAILRGVLLLSQTCRPVKFRRTNRIFPQPATPSHRVPKKPLFSPATMSIERKMARLRLRHRRVTNVALASLSFPRPCRVQQRPATVRAGSTALMCLPRRLPRMTSNRRKNPTI